MEWHRFGIMELQGLYDRADVTPTQLLDHYLARIKKFNPILKAFVEVDNDGARVAAQESTRRFRAGEQRPLEGVPIGVKANIAVKGLELNAGMAARRGLIADQDAEAVKRLRDAGAIILGSLNMHEAALGATTDNPFFGRCLNPHGREQTPGGSSGGSASAVSAGLSVIALGTDTLGSIRVPSSYCGVFGLKPTANKISNEGVVPLSERFDAVGPIARTLDDLSLVTNILCSIDLSAAMRRARLIGLGNLGGVTCSPGVEAAFRAALAEIPPFEHYSGLPDQASRIRKGAFAIAVADLVPHLVELGEERCALLSDEMGRLIDFGLDRSEIDQAEDSYLVTTVGAMLRDAIGDNGVVITPTTPQTAFPHSEKAPVNQADFTALANIAGLPALSIPIGFDAGGLPVGLQLIGPAHGEALLIAQARMINDRLRGYGPPPAYW